MSAHVPELEMLGSTPRHCTGRTSRRLDFVPL
jgi:hypothetical protein